MDAPVIFPATITFPGIYAEIEVDLPTAEALARLWRAEGFGCVSVALAFPRDPAAPASTESWHPVGIYADLLLEERDLLGGALTRLKLGESERVRIHAFKAPPRGWAEAWDRPFASLGPDEAPEDLDEDALDRVRRLLVKLATTAPEHLASPYRDPGQLPDWFVDLGRREIAAWRRLYMMAEVLLNDPAQRHQALISDDPKTLIGALEDTLQQRLQAGPSTSAAATVEAFLAEACDEHLQRTLDAVTAALLLGREGAVDLPGHVAKPLAKIQKDLERLQERLYELTDALAEHSAPQRDDSDDDGDEP